MLHDLMTGQLVKKKDYFYCSCLGLYQQICSYIHIYKMLGLVLCPHYDTTLKGVLTFTNRQATCQTYQKIFRTYEANKRGICCCSQYYSLEVYQCKLLVGTADLMLSVCWELPSSSCERSVKLWRLVIFYRLICAYSNITVCQWEDCMWELLPEVSSVNISLRYFICLYTTY
jgi:hypothetical protein